jgi:hypothetical protein
MRRPRRTALALAVAVCAAVAAQQGTAVSHARSDSDDLALAKRIVLRVADFPAGWSGKPDSSKDSGCFTRPLKAKSPTAFVLSQRLTSHDQSEESSAIVVVYPSTAIARRALAAATTPAPFACYRSKLPAQLALDDITLSSYTGGSVPFGAVGDTALAKRYAIGLKKGGATGTLYTDYIFVRRRRVVIATFFAEEATRPLLTDEQTVLAKAVARVR